MNTKTETITLSQLREVEQLLAKIAAQELMPRFLQVEASHKADGSLITEADLAMQQQVLASLGERFPQMLALGEEMDARQQQQLLQQGQPLWVLDPLDGTANFAAGIPFFGVSLALLAGGQVQVGVVYDPVRRESFSALRGQGAWLNAEPLRVEPAARPLREAMAMVDLKRLPSALIERLAQQAPYRSQRSFGSVALDWCWLAASRVQVYLHGGQRLWDYAAGSLILAEAGGSGGVFEDYAGTRVAAPVLEPRIGLAATSSALFEEWDSWLRAGV